MTEEWKSSGVQETLLLPIGDSQPTDRRLPASSLHSATTGKKRRTELFDKTYGRERGMKTVAGMRKIAFFFIKKKKQQRERLHLINASTSSSGSGWEVFCMRY